MNTLDLMRRVRAGLRALASQPRHVFGARAVRPLPHPPAAKDKHG